MTDLNQRIDELARTLADQAIDAHNRLAYPRATIETLFASAMRKLVEEVEQAQWHPASDPPDDGVSVLCELTVPGLSNEIRAGYYLPTRSAWFYDGDDTELEHDGAKVVHYRYYPRPIPAPPEVK